MSGAGLLRLSVADDYLYVIGPSGVRVGLCYFEPERYFAGDPWTQPYETRHWSSAWWFRGESAWYVCYKRFKHDHYGGMPDEDGAWYMSEDGASWRVCGSTAPAGVEGARRIDAVNVS